MLVYRKTHSLSSGLTTRLGDFGGGRKKYFYSYKGMGKVSTPYGAGKAALNPFPCDHRLLRETVKLGRVALRDTGCQKSSEYMKTG